MRQELLDAVLVLALLQQELHAAQIPLPFLADVADEQHVVRGVNFAASIARMTESISARPRVSSPTPGASAVCPRASPSRQCLQGTRCRGAPTIASIEAPPGALAGRP